MRWAATAASSAIVKGCGAFLAVFMPLLKTWNKRMQMRWAATAASSATAMVKGWCVGQQRLLLLRGALGSNGCFFRDAFLAVFYAAP
jgi:hypothetical protein